MIIDDLKKKKPNGAGGNRTRDLAGETPPIANAERPITGPESAVGWAANERLRLNGHACAAQIATAAALPDIDATYN